MTLRRILLEELAKYLPEDIPNLGMNKGQLCKLLTKEARLYLKKMQKRKKQFVGLGTAALLLEDFINHVGLGQGLDLAIKAEDLLAKRCKYAENIGD